METVFEKNEESPVENKPAEDKQHEEVPTIASEATEHDRVEEGGEKLHHHHAHPHILTIEYTNHGRTNLHSFGLDHEPGAGV